MNSADEILIDVKSEFPIKEQYIFLNHAAVAPIPTSTQFAISEFARDAAEEGPANYASWLHGLTVARQNAGELLNCAADDVCFVKNTTHGVLIAANSINWMKGDNVVTLAHEFPANVHPWRNLREQGVELRVVEERDDYTFSIDDIAAQIDSRTRLVAASWVEYSTGFRNDLDQLSSLCSERGVMLCVDAIQGLGVLPLDLSRTRVDFLVADGHKWLLAPEGCGIMYVRREIIGQLNSSMLGWCGLRNPQEYDNYEQPYKTSARRFEEGSHNLMAIMALGTSIRLILDAGMSAVSLRVAKLTSDLIRRLEHKNYNVLTPHVAGKRAGIVSFTKPGINPAAVAGALAEQKIIIASRRGVLRASPHFYNDEAELDRLISALP